ncbi:MAG: primosomal protein N' [Eubacterium sp.]|nr:primosomal protein N' [Eubacterium sp.]
MYADVIVDISHKAVDRTFSYRIPRELEGEVSVGSVVSIPFGSGKRPRKGYVIQISEHTDFDEDKVKDICGAASGDLLLESRMIALASWMKKRYGSTMIQAINAVTPVKSKVRTVKGKVDIRRFEPEFLPVEMLNKEQQTAVNLFAEDYDKGIRRTYLLYGVTGSGKTEVYLQMAKKVIEEGKQVIVLVPEIALTYQTVGRFRTVFQERVALLHSGLSRGEKYREYEQAAEGGADIVIGPRSALFAPLPHVGLIIIDEEHDGAYKSDTAPRYHAREVAIRRAEMEGASVVLGSATPSVESFCAAEEGRYTLLRLMERAKGQSLPEVEIVDMRQELREGNRSILSRSLYTAMQEAFQRKEQVMLFLNRRGMSSFVSCRSCGEAIRCPRCDVSLSLHGKDTLVCHYCGHTQKMGEECPSCHSKLIGGYGIGTEKVEEEVRRLFPDIRTLRMDRDTTQRKGAHGEILSAFQEGRADCLVGTQMIVKGHDFPKVTVVGILLADMGLFAGDFRSAERTFDLLTQAAGRAGRGDLTGKVMIQTYKPDHYVIETAAGQNYDAFYDFEIAYRRLLFYPPVMQMLGILLTCADESVLIRQADRIAGLLREEAGKEKLMVTGPARAAIYKISDVYRRAIYIRAESEEQLSRIPERLQKENEQLQEEGVEIHFDLAPMHVL